MRGSSHSNPQRICSAVHFPCFRDEGFTDGFTEGRSPGLRFRLVIQEDAGMRESRRGPRGGVRHPFSQCH